MPRLPTPAAVLAALSAAFFPPHADASVLQLTTSSTPLGAPLDLRIAIVPAMVGDTELPRNCVEATVRYGSFELPPSQVRIARQGIDGLGRRLVAIRSPMLVNEPIVHLHVASTCGTLDQQEWTVFADPYQPATATGIRDSTANAARFEVIDSLAGMQDTATAAGDSTLPPEQRAQPVPATSQGDPGGADGTRPRPPAPSIAASRTASRHSTTPRVAAPDPMRQAATAHAAASRTAGSRTLETGTPPALPAPTPGGIDRQAAQGLLDEIARLREAHLRQVEVISDLRRRVASLSSDTGSTLLAPGQQGTAFLAAQFAGFLIVAASAFALGRMRRVDRLPNHHHVIAQPRTEPRTLSPAPGEWAIAKAPVIEVRAQEPEDSPPEPPATAAALDARPPSSLLAKVNEMAESGFHGAAAVLLETRLQASAAASPHLLLRLLDLYDEMAQPWNRERVARQLCDLYNVRFDAATSDRGPALWQYEASWDVIEAAWGAPSAATLLRDMLLRPALVEDLGLDAFAELLALHDLARVIEDDSQRAADRSSSNLQPSAFSPVTLAPPWLSAPASGAASGRAHPPRAGTPAGMNRPTASTSDREPSLVA